VGTGREAIEAFLDSEGPAGARLVLDALEGWKSDPNRRIDTLQMNTFDVVLDRDRGVARIEGIIDAEISCSVATRELEARVRTFLAELRL
jgi:hypothetical protein